MSNDEARFLVAMALRSTSHALVYEGRVRVGQRAVPDLIVVDPDTGATSKVRVMVGKRPRKNGGLYFDTRRVGLWADQVALVDRDSAAVSFRPLDPVTGR